MGREGREAKERVREREKEREREREKEQRGGNGQKNHKGKRDEGGDIEEE